jgi:small nuclear ribonucleoprotein (snRNP)-like protein
MASITTQLSDTEFNTYNNTTLSGSQVLNAVRQYMNLDTFGVQVITGKQYAVNTDTTGTYYGNTFTVASGVVTSVTNSKNITLTEAENQSSNQYINPSGKFKSSIVRDNNNMIRGIIFIQQNG